MAEAETKEYFSTSLCLYYLTIEKTIVLLPHFTGRR